ncbi:MAG: DUF2934 domain-containing protein [Rhodocyclaceae bacterium]|jgi:hypothetical protein|nr:DUF2934 domain-containing protein [Rhodocyclaceae bacterium]
MPTRSTTKTAKPAVKTAAGKAVAKPPRAAPSRPRAKKAGAVSREERWRLIAEAAYFKAEQRGFAGGGELDDWIEAEAEIDALLNSRGSS